MAATLNFMIWGFPKIRATLWRGRYDGENSVSGFFLGPPICGSYHIKRDFGLRVKGLGLQSSVYGFSVLPVFGFKV